MNLHKQIVELMGEGFRILFVRHGDSHIELKLSYEKNLNTHIMSNETFSNPDLVEIEIRRLQRSHKEFMGVEDAGN